MRVSLYPALGEVDESEKQHNHSSLHHVRHCFDYLRQSLICAADTNLEPVDWSAGGVTGWGIERQCRDYGGIVEWANTWRTHNQTNVS